MKHIYTVYIIARLKINNSDYMQLGPKSYCRLIGGQTLIYYDTNTDEGGVVELDGKIVNVVGKYIDVKFNPDMYEQVDVTNVSRILQDTLHRCYKYEHTTGDDKYKYSINEQEVTRIMHDIAYSLNIMVEEYYE